MEDKGPHNIEDLPIAILANNVGQYLINTSRAFFAVAMTASSSSWEACNWSRKPTATSMAIVAACKKKYHKKKDRHSFRGFNDRSGQLVDPWTILDSSDFPELSAWNCKTKLTDGEFGGFLVCIDAVNKLQRLALPGNITGSGLTPLNGSTVLQQIDCTFLDANIVIPILHSILDKSEMSLVHVDFTYQQKEKSEMVDQFMERFEKCLNEKDLICFSCKGVCKGGTKDSILHLTCYRCLNHCCIECKYQYYENKLCNRCDICSDCVDMRVCNACDVAECLNCTDAFPCAGCGLSFCCDGDGCEGGGQTDCGVCGKNYCKDCIEFVHCDICDMRENKGYYTCKDGVCTECAPMYGFEPCTECNRTICFDCGTKKCNTEIVHKCLSCTKKAHLALLDGLSKIECGHAGVHSAQDAMHEIQELIGKDDN